MKKHLNGSIIFGLINIVVLHYVIKLLGILIPNLTELLNVAILAVGIHIVQWIVFRDIVKEKHWKQFWVCNILSLITYDTIMILADNSQWTKLLVFILITFTVIKLVIDSIVTLILYNKKGDKNNE